MTQNADIIPEGDGRHQVVAYRDFCCPACGRCLCSINGKANLKIQCSRCKAYWRVVEGEEPYMIKPPKHVAGKMLLDGVERFFKQNK